MVSCKQLLSSLFVLVAYTFQVVPEIMRQQLPETFSFCIADIKFTGDTLKILEFGEGGRSRFKGYDALNGYGSMWRHFWDHMAQYQVPVWLVGMPSEEDKIRELNTERFMHIGGKSAPTLTMMQRQIMEELRQIHGDDIEQACKDYKGITLIKHGRPVTTVKAIKEKFPGMLFVGQMSNKFVNNKYRMSQLFTTEALQQYRPGCQACPAQYDAGLAQRLIDTMKCDMFVIKPVNSSRGRGIMMVPQSQLDDTFKIIFGDREALAQSDLSEEYKYWAAYKNDIFLVEEFAVSKTIIVDDLPFDATMRLVFSFECSADGQLDIKVYDGYWKLPSYPLSADVSLTEKHKSDIRPDDVSSVKIDPEDFTKASVMLQDMLHKLYWQMLAIRFFTDGR